MQCVTCGSTMPATASICTDCGMELQEGVSPQNLANSDSASPNLPTSPEASSSPDEQKIDATVVIEPESSDNDFSFDAFDLPSGNDTPAPDAVPETPAAPAAPAAPAPAAPAPAARLTLKRNGVLTGDVFPLGGRVVIGRFDVDSGPVDIDMASLPEAAYVSRRHAEIWCEEEEWKIKDLGARNGTFVQSGDGQFQRVTGEQVIRDGDEVALGNARFEFNSGG